jgi:hypothetical protein
LSVWPPFFKLTRKLRGRAKRFESALVMFEELHLAETLGCFRFCFVRAAQIFAFV